MTNEQTDWKSKFNELLDTCQNELKKTTQIGKKMLSASQSNAELQDTYRALGVIFKQCLVDGTVKVDNPEIEELLATAAKLEADMEGFESDVQTLKKSK